VLSRFGYVKTEAQEGVMVGVGHYATAKVITPSFEDMLLLYLSDPAIKGGIDELAESCVGHGGFVTAKAANKLTAEQITSDVNDWLEQINLDEINQIEARELWATGNTITEVIDPNQKWYSYKKRKWNDPSRLTSFKHLPIATFDKLKYVDKIGNIEYYNQRIGAVTQKLHTTKVLHWKWNPLDTRKEHGVGRGLIEVLLRAGRGYTWKDSSGVLHQEFRPSIAETMEEIEDSLRKVLRRYPPRHLIQLAGFDDKSAKSFATKYQNLRVEEDVIVQTKTKAKQSVEVSAIKIDPRSKLDPFVNYFMNLRMLALETPSQKLFLEAGFTEA